MKGDSADLLRLGLTVVVCGLAGRYLWSRLVKKSKSRAHLDVKASGGNAPEEEDDGSGEQKPEDGLWIYFGSQSGTAEAFSHELESEAPGYNVRATVVDLEDFEPEVFAKHRAVALVVATYGEGDPTDNAAEFFKWLQDESLDSATLEGIHFSVMGLGNRQYVNFNTSGKVADQHMKRLGAECIYERGEGDDDQNIEEDFEQWKENGFWEAVQKAIDPKTPAGALIRSGTVDFGGLETGDSIRSRLPLRVEVASEAKALPVDPLVQSGGADVLGKWYFNASLAPVTVCNELRQVADQDSGKTTKHMEVDVKAFPALQWKTADNLEVLPRNPPEVVDWFAERLGLKDQLDSSLTFVRPAGATGDKVAKKLFPSPCPIRTALGLYCDLFTAPGKMPARKMAAFATDPEERSFLESLLQDSATYQWLTGESVRLSFSEFLDVFLKSAEIDLGSFLQLCPRQKSRPYTISSSHREDANSIGICVSMLREELPSMASVFEGLESRGHEVPRAAEILARLGKGKSQQPRCFNGLCSTMLCTRVACEDKLWVYARASSFRLPKRSSTPILMFGAGTGVAPFRAFEREFRAEGAIRPKTMLFFGCTKKDEDYLYREEFQEAISLQPPPLSELVMAFSRDGPDKVYVQHRLNERQKEVAGLINDGGYIYVCGSNRMGNAVREEIAKALGNADYVSRLQTEGRYVEELW